MEMTGFVLILILLALSIALYIAGVLVVDRITWCVQLDHKVQQLYRWLAVHGRPETQPVALAAAQSRDLEQLQALVGADL